MAGYYETMFTEENWRLLEHLCGLPTPIVSNENILWIMRSQQHLGNMSYSTLAELIKKRYQSTFKDYRKQKQASWVRNIVAKQYELAMKGNTGLLIWLGKQYCGQSDNPEPIDQTEPKHEVELTEENDEATPAPVESV